MKIRLQLSEMFNELKEDHGKTYSQITSEGNITRSQIAAIVKGENGISVDKIAEVIEVVFDVKIAVSYYE